MSLTDEQFDYKKCTNLTQYSSRHVVIELCSLPAARILLLKYRLTAGQCNNQLMSKQFSPEPMCELSADLQATMHEA